MPLTIGRTAARLASSPTACRIPSWWVKKLMMHRPRGRNWYFDESFFIGGSKGTSRNGIGLQPDGPKINYKDNWGSAHPGGVQFLFGDGAVQLLAFEMDPTVLTNMMTIEGGEEADTAMRTIVFVSLAATTLVGSIRAGDLKDELNCVADPPNCSTPAFRTMARNPPSLSRANPRDFGFDSPP